MTIRNPIEWSGAQFVSAAHAAEAVGRSLEHMREVAHSPAPAIRRIKSRDIWQSLREGFSDFEAYRSDVIFLCVTGAAEVASTVLLFLFALRYAGLKQDDIDWFELNEAFAAQSLAVVNTLGLDPAKVNPMGGAIALGHPLGATGAIRSATVVHALRRKQLRYGMVTMCVGMGQGAAGIFERV